MGNFDAGAFIGATSLVVLVWLFVVVARTKSEWNPLVLTQGPFGRASLTSQQHGHELACSVGAYSMPRPHALQLDNNGA